MDVTHSFNDETSMLIYIASDSSPLLLCSIQVSCHLNILYGDNVLKLCLCDKRELRSLQQLRCVCLSYRCIFGGVYLGGVFGVRCTSA